MTPVLLRPHWLAAAKHYLVAVAVGNVAWEFAEMPLYTLWRTGTPGGIAFAALHCAAGDVLIAAVALFAALVAVGTPEWPRQRFVPVAVTSGVLGVGYTVFSEYLNTVVRHSWAYSGLMPTLPWLGAGVAPLAQWLAIPPLSLAWACRQWRTTSLKAP